MRLNKIFITVLLFGIIFPFTTFAFNYNPTISFDKNLKLGMRDADVKELQIFLNNNGFIVSNTGVGSIGKETNYFGSKTKEALIKFQEKYKSDILEPLSIKHGTGLFYSSTRNFINKNKLEITESTPIITVVIPSTTSTSSMVVTLPTSTTSESVATTTIFEEIQKPKTYTVTYEAEYGGKIIGNTSQEIQENTTGTEVTAVADGGYYFIDWSDGLTTTSRTDSNISENKVFTANFGYRKKGSGIRAISLSSIEGVIAPVKHATPVTEITETNEYTGIVEWSPSASEFAADTVYTATITLTPKQGYTLSGIIEDFFTVDGATTTNDINTGVITAEFPKTESLVYSYKDMESSYIQEENGYIYYTNSGVLYKTPNIDLSSSTIAFSGVGGINRFILGNNINVITYYNDGNKINVYNKNWELLNSTTSSYGSAQKTKKILNNIFVFNEGGVMSIPDQENIESGNTDEFYFSNIVSGGNTWDIEYFNSNYYKIIAYNAGSTLIRDIYKGDEFDNMTMIKQYAGYYSFATGDLFSSSIGLLLGLESHWQGPNVLTFTLDGENWSTEHNIGETPGLNFGGEVPNSYYRIGVDSNNVFYAYSKAYIVNFTNNPIDYVNWTFAKTGLTQSGTAPSNDVIFTEKGIGYFVDGKYIYGQ